MSELSMWHLFECLIDGLCVMHYGSQITPVAVVPATVPPTFTAAAPAAVGPNMVLHLDLKGENSTYISITGQVCANMTFSIAHQ